MQHQHLAARQQGAVEFKGRIFRGGAHPGDGAVLHHRQEPILLRAVEAVYFVDEQQRGLTDAAAPRSLVKDAFQVRDPRKHRGYLDEEQLRLGGEQAGDRRLADARRAPEDEGRERAPRQHPGDRTLRSEQMILANDLGKRLGTKAIGQRTMAGWFGGLRRRRCAEKILGVGHADSIERAARSCDGGLAPIAGALAALIDPD